MARRITSEVDNEVFKRWNEMTDEEREAIRQEEQEAEAEAELAWQYQCLAEAEAEWEASEHMTFEERYAHWY